MESELSPKADSRFLGSPSHSLRLVGNDKHYMTVANQEDDRIGPQRHQLKYRWMPSPYAIVKLAPHAPVPDWATKGEFTSITRSVDELSIVCPAEDLPADVNSPQRWICLKLEGPFPFSLTGVLLSFIEPLSTNGVPIFAISTYDTDYVLIQQEFTWAIDVLREAGHELWPRDESWRKFIE
jgi:uncharacterized protein